MTGPARLARTPAVLLLAISACAHSPRREVLSAAGEQRCEDAFYFFSVGRPPSPADQARRVVTTPISWAFTVVGFGADVALRVTAGAAAGAAVCMPIVMLEAAFKSNGEATAQCFTGIAGAVVASDELPSVGRGVRNSTRTWRCPDLAPIAREARAVAGCYAARAMPDDAERARQVLLSIREARRIWECLPAREQRAVIASLSVLPPPPAPPPGAEPPWSPGDPGPPPAGRSE